MALGLRVSQKRSVGIGQGGTEAFGKQRTSHERSRHNEDNGRFADYFIHLLLGVKLRDAPVGSTIWIQRI